ncbi:coatomer, beta' subunit [Actinidia rufa]|uniref:Coatomer, beta' subunit n=1 Tax=Actinidia rufa TaxID=165716 RepID=A0A7J0GMB5_9ERIC|nr:coatomer, beta' subunit [Actinidia rufa]
MIDHRPGQLMQSLTYPCTMALGNDASIASTCGTPLVQPSGSGLECASKASQNHDCLRWEKGLGTQLGTTRGLVFCRLNLGDGATDRIFLSSYSPPARERPPRCHGSSHLRQSLILSPPPPVILCHSDHQSSTDPCLPASKRHLKLGTDADVKNLYWADSGDLVLVASDASFYILKKNHDVVSTCLDSGRPVDEQNIEDAFELLYEINECVWIGIWVGDCFIYNSFSRPNNLITVFVMGYTLLLGLIEYNTLVMHGDLEQANEILPSIPKEHHNRSQPRAPFLVHKFEVEMAEDCLKNAIDLSGVLLFYSSLGDKEGISQFASLAKEHEKNNVAFLCPFVLSKLEECLHLLFDSNRIPEACFDGTVLSSKQVFQR